MPFSLLLARCSDFPIPSALQQGRVYIAITSKGYPSRYIYSSSDGSSRGVLGALKREVIEKFPDASLTCPPNGLDSKVKPLLKVRI